MLQRSILACMVCCLALSAGCAAQISVMSVPVVTVSGPAVTVEAEGPSSNPGNTQWRLACPQGMWMFGVDIAGDPIINALGPIYCHTFGQGPNVTKTGEMAGWLPTPAIQWREYGSSTGYSTIAFRNAKTMPLIEAISFVYGFGESAFEPGRSLSPGTPSQAYGGIGDGATQFVACPAGHIITELFGETSGRNILTIGLRCRRSSGAAAAAATPSIASEPAGTPAGRKLKQHVAA